MLFCKQGTPSLICGISSSHNFLPSFLENDVHKGKGKAFVEIFMKKIKK